MWPKVQICKEISSTKKKQVRPQRHTYTPFKKAKSAVSYWLVVDMFYLVLYEIYD